LRLCTRLCPRVTLRYDRNHVAFLCGANLQQSNGKVTHWGFSGMDNPCESLSFATKGGTFLSTEKVDWAGMDFGTVPTRLRFSVRGGTFQTENTKPAKYFAIPLLNCVAELTNQLYGKHPLRIFPTPSIPDNIPPEKMMTAKLIANQKFGLGFLFR